MLTEGAGLYKKVWTRIGNVRTGKGTSAVKGRHLKAMGASVTYVIECLSLRHSTGAGCGWAGEQRPLEADAALKSSQSIGEYAVC